MKILALDSSGLVASVALLENDNLVAEFTVNNKKTHSQTLLPMLDEVVNAAGIELDAVDAIAIAAGPGVIYRTAYRSSNGKRTVACT